MNLENSVATPLMLRYAQETALLSTNGVVKFGERPFALSSPRSGCIEGLASFN